MTYYKHCQGKSKNDIFAWSINTVYKRIQIPFNFTDSKPPLVVAKSGKVWKLWVDITLLLVKLKITLDTIKESDALECEIVQSSTKSKFPIFLAVKFYYSST